MDDVTNLITFQQDVTVFS